MNKDIQINRKLFRKRVKTVQTVVAKQHNIFHEKKH